VKVKLDTYKLWEALNDLGVAYITTDEVDGIITDVSLGTQVSHTEFVQESVFLRTRSGALLKIKPDKPGYCRIYQTG